MGRQRCGAVDSCLAAGGKRRTRDDERVGFDRGARSIPAHGSALGAAVIADDEPQWDGEAKPKGAPVRAGRPPVPGPSGPSSNRSRTHHGRPASSSGRPVGPAPTRPVPRPERVPGANPLNNDLNAARRRCHRATAQVCGYLTRPRPARSEKLALTASDTRRESDGIDHCRREQRNVRFPLSRCGRPETQWLCDRSSDGSPFRRGRPRPSAPEQLDQ